jgi:hypothetical protein
VVDAQPGLNHQKILVHHQDRMASAYLDANLVAQLLAQVLGQGPPGVEIVGAEERELDPILICGIAVDGDSSAVRAAVRHLDQHGREIVPKPVLEGRVLGEKAHNSAHLRVLRNQATFRPPYRVARSRSRAAWILSSSGLRKA